MFRTTAARLSRFDRPRLVWIAAVWTGSFLVLLVIADRMHVGSVRPSQTLRVFGLELGDGIPGNITMKTNISGGRFGNNLYQYAALRGIARKTNKTAFIATGMFHRVLRLFDLRLPIRDDVSVSDYQYYQDDQGDVPKSLKTSAALGGGHFLLAGQYQSFRFFDDIKDEIREEFTLKPALKRNADDYLNRVTPPGHVRVGIHVRRGDHLTQIYTEAGFLFPEDSYFARATEYFVKMTNGKVHFIVTSDEVSWCVEHLSKLPHSFSFSYNTDYAEDFAILTSCDHVIITLGTFGWWAGWLNTGTTLHMADFPRPNTASEVIYRPGYYVPENDAYNHWVAI